MKWSAPTNPTTNGALLGLARKFLVITTLTEMPPATPREVIILTPDDCSSSDGEDQPGKMTPTIAYALPAKQCCAASPIVIERLRTDSFDLND
jgi:hypothetical protein